MSLYSTAGLPFDSIAQSASEFDLNNRQSLWGNAHP